MKTVYEQLVENPEYAKLLQTLPEGDKKSMETFAVNLSGFADELLGKVFKGLNGTNVSSDDVSQAIRDRTGRA